VGQPPIRSASLAPAPVGWALPRGSRWRAWASQKLRDAERSGRGSHAKTQRRKGADEEGRESFGWMGRSSPSLPQIVLLFCSLLLSCLRLCVRIPDRASSPGRRFSTPIRGDPRISIPHRPSHLHRIPHLTSEHPSRTLPTGCPRRSPLRFTPIGVRLSTIATGSEFGCDYCLTRRKAKEGRAGH
jgi:hypothetical protein